MFYSTNSRIIDANLNIPLDEHGKNGMWLEKGLFVKEVNSKSLNAIFFFISKETVRIYLDIYQRRQHFKVKK